MTSGEGGRRARGPAAGGHVLDEEMVHAFDGHGERAETPAEVEPALRRALDAVRAGRQAAVNIVCGRARE